jgi:hypothetical protein
MTFDEASERLIVLARDHDGVVTAAQVEQDAELSLDRELVSDCGSCARRDDERIRGAA